MLDYCIPNNEMKHWNKKWNVWFLWSSQQKKKDPTSLLKNNMKHPTKCYKKLFYKPQLKCKKYEDAKQIAKC
jgi:hypothetical protein